MVNEGYSTKQIMEISGAGATAVARWKSQYLEEMDLEIDNDLDHDDVPQSVLTQIESIDNRVYF